MEGAVRLSFRDISISLNLKDGSSKQILDGVSGECTSGRTCALMGPSGAGKTTLVSAVGGDCFDPSAARSHSDPSARRRSTAYAAGALRDAESCFKPSRRSDRTATPRAPAQSHTARHARGHAARGPPRRRGARQRRAAPADADPRHDLLRAADGRAGAERDGACVVLWRRRRPAAAAGRRRHSVCTALTQHTTLSLSPDTARDRCARRC